MCGVQGPDKAPEAEWILSKKYPCKDNPPLRNKSKINFDQSEGVLYFGRGVCFCCGCIWRRGFLNAFIRTTPTLNNCPDLRPTLERQY